MAVGLLHECTIATGSPYPSYPASGLHHAIQREAFMADALKVCDEMDEVVTSDENKKAAVEL
jgi:hypothetical protein